MPATLTTDEKAIADTLRRTWALIHVSSVELERIHRKLSGASVAIHTSRDRITSSSALLRALSRSSRHR